MSYKYLNFIIIRSNHMPQTLNPYTRHVRAPVSPANTFPLIVSRQKHPSSWSLSIFFLLHSKKSKPWEIGSSLYLSFFPSIQPKRNPNVPQSLSEDVRVGRRSRLLQRPSARRRRRRRRSWGGRHRFEPLPPPEIQGVHPKLRDRQQRFPLQREPTPQP